MRAVVVITPGGPDALEVIDTPIPEPGPGQIRIRVAAAGVNPVDVQTRAGFFNDLGWITQDKHTGVGWDVSGVISALGPNVAQDHPELSKGTSVAALLTALDVPLGTYAEEVIVPAEAAAVVPDGLGSTAAATVPLNALTASQALEVFGDAQGRSLLVTGAAGGVGGYAVALATRLGWRVDGLARESDRDFLARTGANGLVTTLQGAYQGYDAIFDAAAIGTPAVEAVRDAGHYVGVLPPSVPEPTRGVRTEAVMVHHDGATLHRLLTQTAVGELEVRVQGTLPLAEAATAHRHLEKGGSRGRWLLIP